MRVVIDTNVLLSGLAYPGSIPGKILSAWRHGSLEGVLSDYLLDELRRVLPLAHRHGLSAEEQDDLIDILSLQAERVEPAVVREGRLRDPDDMPVLGTLLAADASYLITGDRDLLALADTWPVLTPATFWARHGQG